MPSANNPGRAAGFWYLLLTLIGTLRIIYIPDKLVVPDAAATIDNIVTHEWLFRVGMVSELVAGVVLILLTLAFYRLLKGVDQYLARLIVILGVMSAVLNLVNVVSDAGALMVARNTEFFSVFDKPQRDALAMLFLRLHGQQDTVAEILWGLWLCAVAILVYRSEFLPRFLGAWLLLAGVACVLMSLTGLLLPGYQRTVLLVSQPALLGELALMLWLVIKGARAPEPAIGESIRYDLITMPKYPGW
jgi:hypothetical protein